MEENSQVIKILLQSSNNAVIITDKNGIILEYNNVVNSFFNFHFEHDNETGINNLFTNYNKLNNTNIHFDLNNLRAANLDDYIEQSLTTHNGDNLLVRIYNTFNNNTQIENYVFIFLKDDLTDITKNIEPQLAVKRNQEMLRLIIDMIPDRIYLKDSDGKFLINNRAHLNALGVNSQNETIGKTDFDFKPFDSAKKYKDQEFEILNSNNPLIDYYELESNGTDDEKIILISKYPFNISGEPSSGIVGVSKDITKLYKFETQNILLANALKSINECVTITDLEYKLIFVNKAFCKTYEYTEEEVLGKNISIVSASNNDVKSLQKIKLATFNGGWQGELLNISKSGKKIPIWLSTTPIYDKNNIPFALIGVARNISSQKEYEYEILKLNQAIIHSPVSILVTDIDGKIEYSNPKLSEITGYSEQEILNNNPRIFQSGKTPIEVYKELWDTIKAGKEWHGELLNKKKNGELYWEQVSISSIKDKDNQIIQFISFQDDITKIKDLQISLKIARDKAESTNELKDNFIATVSHEVRTPINGILGMTYLIKEAFHQHITPEEQEYFESLNRSSKRIIRTTDLVLNYSKFKSSNVEINYVSVDLVKVFQEIINDNKLLIDKKNINVVFDYTKYIPLINSDLFCITEIFSNIVNNAVKFTENGIVEIRIHQLNNTQLCVEIIDTGIGISNEYLPDLFEPYIQEENGYTRTFDGIGLGLALTKLLIDKIGASINVKSKKGEGTTITVSLNIL